MVKIYKEHQIGIFNLDKYNLHLNYKWVSKIYMPKEHHFLTLRLINYYKT